MGCGSSVDVNGVPGPDPPDSARLHSWLVSEDPTSLGEYKRLLRGNTRIRLRKLHYGQWVPLHLLCKARPPTLTMELLQLFLDRAKEEQLRLTHYTGETALMWLVENWARPPGSFELLLRGNPTAANSCNFSRDTPLHMWCSNRSVTPTIAEAKLVAMVAATPLQRRGRNGYLPLHCYCSLPIVDDSVLRTLIDAYPESVHILAGGCIPLAMRCFSAEGLSGFDTLMEMATDLELRRFSGNGKTLLHFMIESSHKKSLLPRLQLLLHRVPDLASTPSLGMLPLHALMRDRYTTLDQWVFLLRAYPGAAQSELPPNTPPFLRQFLMLQPSCEDEELDPQHDNILCEALQMILPAAGDRARAVAADPTVLHAYLTTSHRSLRVLSLLLGVDSNEGSLPPDAVTALSARDEKGCTPLMLLVSIRSPRKQLRIHMREALWFARAPELFAAVDSDDCSLLHRLCYRVHDFDVEWLSMVLDLIPESLALSKTGASASIGGGQTAAHLLAASHHSRGEFLQALLQRHPTLGAVPDAKGRLPIHIVAATRHIHTLPQLLPLTPPSLVVARDDGGDTLVDLIRRGTRCRLQADVLVEVLAWAAPMLICTDIDAEWWATEITSIGGRVTSRLAEIVTRTNRSAACLRFLQLLAESLSRQTSSEPDTETLVPLQQAWPEGATVFIERWRAVAKGR